MMWQCCWLGPQSGVCIQYCRHSVLWESSPKWEWLIVTPLLFSSQRNNLWGRHLPNFFSPLFFPFLSSRLITVAQIFKDSEYPLTTLETKLCRSMLFCMVQFFFQVRQIVEIITQRCAQKLDLLEPWAVWDCMEKYPGQWAPQHVFLLPLNKSRSQKN